MGIYMVHGVDAPSVHRQGLLDSVAVGQVQVPHAAAKRSRLQAELGTLLRPDVVMTVNTDHIYLIESSQTEMVQTPRDREQRIRVGVLPPVEPGLRHGDDVKEAVLFYEQAGTCVVSMDLESEDAQAAPRAAAHRLPSPSGDSERMTTTAIFRPRPCTRREPNASTARLP